MDEDPKKGKKPDAFYEPLSSNNKLGGFQPNEETRANKKMLNKKRVKNVMRDGNDESDDEDNTRKRFKNNANKPKNSHVVKFSGEEYKSKTGKGDKLLQGKYEPFAYIQLNPKGISRKSRKDNMQVFENLMKKK